VRSKSRQRFREGGFFMLFDGHAVRRRDNGVAAGAKIFAVRAGWWRQSRRLCVSREEPIDFVGFSTISRSALQ
jgi:hypothetical protein